MARFQKKDNFLLLFSLNILAYPIETVFDTLAVHSRTGLNIPCPVTNRMQIQTLSYVASFSRVNQVLFVGEYEHGNAH